MSYNQLIKRTQRTRRLLERWRIHTMSSYLHKRLLYRSVGGTYKDTIGGTLWESYQISFR